MERAAAMTSTSPIRIGVAGAMGRMGHALVAAAKGRDDAAVTVLFDRPEFAGQTPEGLTAPLGDMAAAVAGCDVIMDFTTPTGPGAGVRRGGRSCPGLRHDRRLGGR